MVKNSNTKRELKPCPFCGSDHLAKGHVFGQPYIECLNCGIDVRMEGTDEALMNMWNRRENDGL